MTRYSTLAAAILVVGIAAAHSLLPAFPAEAEDNAVVPPGVASPESVQTLVPVTVSWTERTPVPAELGELSLPEPAVTEPPAPEIVAAFLDSQSAFAAYPLPDAVDYSYTPLPFAFAPPLDGRSSSGFGYRLHPILHTVRFHYGTDIAVPTGAQIGAFADGTVCGAGYDESYGWHLTIDHGDGWRTMYAHCSALCAVEGQSVSVGDCVALAGETGLATGPHLHMELTKDGVYRNPEYYING